MTGIDTEATLGALVAEHPGLAGTLDRLRLDYCCGGGRTLAEACRARGLDADTVALVLERLAEAPPPASRDAHDLRGASLSVLCDHIVEAHHERLRRELPEIQELLATVVRVHGGDHAELHDLDRLFTTLAGDLLEHLASEEAIVFPAARTLDRGGKVDADLVPLVDQHAAAHAETGDALAALRELAGGYAAARAYCGTHRRLLAALEAFELDLHRHVHEENNLLFPGMLARAESRPA